MSRMTCVLVAALVLGSSPVWASEDVIPAPNPLEAKIVPAILHIPGPGEEPLYSSIQFAKAPPILPRNRCEAQCLAEFRACEADCGFLLDLCAADCTDCI